MELAMVEWMVCRVAASMEAIWGEEQVATMDTSLACGKDCWMAVQSETSGVAQKVFGAAERMDVGAAAQTVGTRAGGMVSASVPRLVWMLGSRQAAPTVAQTAAPKVAAKGFE
jgi:hypothetical protein